MFSARSTFVAGDISGIVARIRAGATVGVVQTTEHILQQAQVIVPIDTGELHSSGNVSLEDSADGPCGYVNFDAGHAGYVEFGTGVRGAASPGSGPYPYGSRAGQVAQPYLRPAMDAAHGVFLDNVADGVRNGI